MAKTYRREDIEAVAARNLFNTCLVDNFMFQLDVRVAGRKADEAWAAYEAHQAKSDDQGSFADQREHVRESMRLFDQWQRLSDLQLKLYNDRSVKHEQDRTAINAGQGAHCEKGALSE